MDTTREIGIFQGQTVDIISGGHVNDQLMTYYQADFEALVSLRDGKATTADALMSQYGLTLSGTPTTAQKRAYVLEHILKRLGNMAVNGLSIDHDLDSSTANISVHLNSVALEKINVLITLAKGCGFVLKDGDFNPANLQTGTALTSNTSAQATFDTLGEVERTILEGVRVADVNVSLLHMVNTQYIIRGNEVIFNEMAQLDQTLQVNREVLETLTKIQNLHNEVTVPAVTDFEDKWLTVRSEDPNGRTDEPTTWTQLPSGLSQVPTSKQSNGDKAAFFMNKWQDYADDHFDPSNLNPRYTSGTIPVGDITEVLNDLNRNIADLAAVDGGAATPKEGSLRQKLIAVRNDLPDVTGSDPQTAIRNWIVDNYDEDVGADAQLFGDYQRNIDFAITAGTNLNDDSKENLRRILFIFEEFYKSASAIMQKMTQMLEKMAANIAR